jgi:hypothetical protein
MAGGRPLADAALEAKPMSLVDGSPTPQARTRTTVETLGRAGDLASAAQAA